MTSLVSVGTDFISGEFVDSALVLTRSDGSTQTLPGLLLVRGTLVDHGDSTFDITFEE